MTIPKLNHYSLPRAAELAPNRVDWQLDPQRTALLIHDVQHYFVSFYGTDNPLVQTMIENIQRIKAYCYQHDIRSIIPPSRSNKVAMNEGYC